MEDEEILNLYWKRNEKALSETQEKYGHALCCISRNIVGNIEDAEECVNDTYHKAWESIPPVRPVYFFAYLAKIARHFSFGKLDYWNAAKRSAEITVLNEELDRCIPSQLDEETQIESREIAKIISTFLKKQKEEYRNIFVRRYFYTDSIQDIAWRYDISESKVKSVLFRMRRLLKEYLEKGGICL